MLFVACSHDSQQFPIWSIPDLSRVLSHRFVSPFYGYRTFPAFCPKESACADLGGVAAESLDEGCVHAGQIVKGLQAGGYSLSMKCSNEMHSRARTQV